FSFESGVSSPEVLLDAAAQRGFTALACTDTNGVYGAVEFQQAARARGIRPILGAHLVFGDEEAVVLATDEKGWGALCRATSMVHWKQLPIAAQLATDREGLIVLSSNIPFLERVVALSGPTDLYAELRPGKERHAVGAAARRLGIRAAVTNAVKFANPEDFQRHRLRVAIARNITLSQLPIADCRVPSEDRSAISNQQLFPPDLLAPPSQRPLPLLPRLPRGIERERGDCRTVRIPPAAGPASSGTPFCRGRRCLPAVAHAGIRGCRAAIRHHCAGDAGPAGARAGDHRPDEV